MRIFLSLSSFSGFLLFFLISKKVKIFPLYVPEWLQYIIYILICILFAYITLRLMLFQRRKDAETMKGKKTKALEPTLLPTYIGLFIISIGLDGRENIMDTPAHTIIIIVLLFIIWSFFEKIACFNIFWVVVFGYRYYEVETANGYNYLILKHKDKKGPVEEKDLVRINNFTFLEKK